MVKAHHCELQLFQPYRASSVQCSTYISDQQLTAEPTVTTGRLPGAVWKLMLKNDGLTESVHSLCSQIIAFNRPFTIMSTKWRKYKKTCVNRHVLIFRTRKRHQSICLLVFSPFSAHFYPPPPPPLHHNGKGSNRPPDPRYSPLLCR